MLPSSAPTPLDSDSSINTVEKLKEQVKDELTWFDGRDRLPVTTEQRIYIQKQSIVLGKGSFARVLYSDAVTVTEEGSDNPYPVIKMLASSPDSTEEEEINKQLYLLREARMHAAINDGGHPNILPFYFLLIEGNVPLGIVMPYRPTTLYQNIVVEKTDFTPGERVEIANGLINGLAYLHESSVLHRDVKTANILMHSITPQYADFGTAVLAEEGTYTDEQEDFLVTTELYASSNLLTQSIGRKPITYSQLDEITSLMRMLIELITKQVSPVYVKYLEHLQDQKDIKREKQLPVTPKDTLFERSMFYKIRFKPQCEKDIQLLTSLRDNNENATLRPLIDLVLKLLNDNPTITNMQQVKAQLQSPSTELSAQPK